MKSFYLSALLAAFILALLSVQSCTKEEVHPSSYPEFDAMKSQNDQLYWLNRLNSYSSITMNGSLRILVDSLSFEVSSNYSDKNARIQEIGISISKQISRRDFFDLFVERDSVTVTTIVIDPNGCAECGQRLLNWASVSAQHDPNIPDCNCDWTCGDIFAECSHSDCNTTSSGCGFLWLGP